METINKENPHKCYICKSEATEKNLDVCDKCREKLLADRRILCIEAEEKGEVRTSTGRSFTIREEDFINVLPPRPNTMKFRFCTINREVFNIMIEKAKKESKIEENEK